MITSITEQAKIAREEEIDSEYAKLLIDHMSSWTRVGDIVYSSCTTENKVLGMLGFELETRRRPYVTKRILARYSGLRHEREKKEIEDLGLQ